MRKTGFFIAAFLLSALVAAAVAGLDRRPPTTGKEGVSSNLPIVLRPENTPTPTPNQGHSHATARVTSSSARVNARGRRGAVAGVGVIVAAGRSRCRAGPA